MSQKKEAILKAATLLFSEKGYRNTSMAELSKMTGTAEGTIFYHFKNKEALFLFILQKLKEDLLEECERYFGAREFESGLDMMEDAVSFYLHLAGSMEDRFLLLHRQYPYELAEVNPVCRGYLADIYNCLVDIFERAVMLGQKDGSIGEMPARKTALLVFAMVDGLVRFKIYSLYAAGSLYSELIASVRRMLENR